MIFFRHGVLFLGLSFGCLYPISCLGQGGKEDFARREIFLQFGGSIYTGNTGPGETILVAPPGQPPQPILGVRESIFSKSGRGILGARYWFRQNQGLELSLSYAPNILRGIETFPPTGNSIESVPVQTHATNVAFNYVRRLPSRGRLEPFLTGGAGIAIFDAILETEKKFVINFGAGTDLRLSRRVLFRFEFRDFFSGQPTGRLIRTAGGATHNLVPSAGLAFRF